MTIKLSWKKVCLRGFRLFEERFGEIFLCVCVCLENVSKPQWDLISQASRLERTGKNGWEYLL